MTHTFNAQPERFEQVKKSSLVFEVVKSDRKFNIGDDVILQEQTADKKYTGNETRKTIAATFDDHKYVRANNVILVLKDKED